MQIDSPQSTSAVHAEYSRRLADRRAEMARHTSMDVKLGNWRLIVAGAGLLFAYWAFGKGGQLAWLAAIPLVIFIVLWKSHEKTGRLLDRSTRAVAFYEAGLRRCEDKWAGTGITGARFSDSAHPYVDDLDIFGPGSLFELLCTARTRAGEECLAEWLRTPSSPETIRARQAAIADLRPRLDLREDMALLGQTVRNAINPEALAAWGEEPIWVVSPVIRIISALFAAATLAAAVAWGMGKGNLPFFGIAIAGAIFDATMGSRVKRVVRSVEKPGRDLAVLSALLARIEKEEFTAPLLTAFRVDLVRGEALPSARIARLQSLIDSVDAARNMVFAMIAKLLLWTTQFAFVIEDWRAENGSNIRQWLRIAGEFEALCALASYAYEHPEDVFPEIIDAGECFNATGLGHPLIPVTKVVRNDISIGGKTRLFIVSGSNMSGKSTLMRSVGVNIVLALAGAPVRAHALSLTPLSIGASIRTNDSLQAGISRFYAEITRLHQVVEMAGQTPTLLFLIDEILHGTNSHDRRIGGEAVLRTLVKRGAIGLTTTHDLALTQIANDGTLTAINVHFEDQLTDGKITFDNRLRPGVVEKSNAIELMRAVGLVIEPH